MNKISLVVTLVLVLFTSVSYACSQFDFSCYMNNPTYQNCVWQANLVHSGCQSSCSGQAQQFCSSIQDFEERMACQGGYQTTCENMCDDSHCSDIGSCYDSSNCFYNFAAMFPSSSIICKAVVDPARYI